MICRFIKGKREMNAGTKRHAAAHHHHIISPALTFDVGKKTPTTSSIRRRRRRRRCGADGGRAAAAAADSGITTRLRAAKKWEVVVGVPPPPGTPIGARAAGGAAEWGGSVRRTATAFNVVACVNFVLTAVLFVHVEFGGVFDLARHPAGMANRAGTSIVPQIASALAIQGLGVWAVRCSGRSDEQVRGNVERDAAVFTFLPWQPHASTLVALYLLFLPAHFFVCVLHVPYFLYVLRYIVDVMQLLLAQKHFSRVKYCWFSSPGSSSVVAHGRIHTQRRLYA